VIDPALTARMEEVSLADAVSPPTTETIYILILDEEIVYIGCTCNFAQRIGMHVSGTKRQAAKGFNRVLRMEVPIADSAAFEGALIRRFNPPLTWGAPADESRDAEMLSLIGLSFDQAMRDAFVDRRRKMWVDAHCRARQINWVKRRAWSSPRTFQGVLWKSTVRFLKRHEAAAS
jgi:hypothetical protein